MHDWSLQITPCGIGTGGLREFKCSRYFLLPIDQSCSPHFLPHNYDVVVHDLFSGGGVPQDLCTQEAFGGLKALLRPEGVLAVNFYGFVSGHLTRVMFARLQRVFAHVRTFRDEHSSDSANMVFFASDAPLQFRKPSRRNFHGSAMREQFLTSFLNWELKIVPAEHEPTPKEMQSLFDEITREHWHSIRQVFPAPFWQNF